MTNTQIPKVIHYCWFGRNPLPSLAEMCIASWRKYLPDYEIKEWNEDNFDVNITTYTEEAYRAKKYAYVSDYARFWVLYHYGGVYFDVDVEVVKPIDDILERGPFMGLENLSGPWLGTTAAVAAGLGMASYPHLPFFGEMLDYYKDIHFFTPKGKLKETVVLIVTRKLLAKGGYDVDKVSLCAGIYIYPNEYFNAMNIATRQIVITPNTCSIHHYAGSWVDKTQSKMDKYVLRTKNVFIMWRVWFRRKFEALRRLLGAR